MEELAHTMVLARELEAYAQTLGAIPKAKLLAVVAAMRSRVIAALRLMHEDA